MKKIFPVFVLAMLVCLCACDNPQRAVDQAKKNLDAFRADPRAETQEKVEQSSTKLDEEVSKLEKKTDAATGDAQKKLSEQLQKIKSQRAELVSDYRSAKVNKVINDLKTSVQEIGNAVKSLGKPSDTNR